MTGSGARSRGGARADRPERRRAGPGRVRGASGPPCRRRARPAQSSPPGQRPTPWPAAGKGAADRRRRGQSGEPQRRASPAAGEFRGGGEGGQDAPSPRHRGRAEGPRRRPGAAHPEHPEPPPAPPPSSPFTTWRCPRPAASCAQAGNALTDTISEAPKMADVSSRP